MLTNSKDLFSKTDVRLNTSESYRLLVEKGIQESCEKIGPQGALKDACIYTLKSGGKRIRPIIVLMVAHALYSTKNVMPSALAIEYFHTASLVADDLPCMDDDAIRRNQPSTHKKYGESIALLTSYALIAAGYGMIAENIQTAKLSDACGILALECASFNTGLYGATGGQFLDIQPPNLNLETLREIIHKKTVSLFEIAFVFGWLFGGGSKEKLPQVKQLASHFGFAFQIADDLDDIESDVKNGRKVNLAVVFGVEKAKQFLNCEVKGYLDMLATLEIESVALKSLIEIFDER